MTPMDYDLEMSLLDRFKEIGVPFETQRALTDPKVGHFLSNNFLYGGHVLICWQDKRILAPMDLKQFQR
jgi:hypothetical protein